MELCLLNLCAVLTLVEDGIAAGHPVEGLYWVTSSSARKL